MEDAGRSSDHRKQGVFRDEHNRTAEVSAVSDEKVSFELEDGRTLELDNSDPALRHLDHAWGSTVHAFQGRTVDNVIAAMEAGHPHLTTQKSFYVEISRARDKAELVTDDAARLKEHLETATGERISALEGIAGRAATSTKESELRSEEMEGTPASAEPEKAVEPKSVDRGLEL